MNDIIVSILIVLGGGFAAIAGLGLLRLPDVLIRMHASTKAGTLGVGLIVLGVSVHFATSLVITKALLIIAFLFLTAPVGAHLVGRAAYRRGLPLWDKTLVDDAAMKTKVASDSTTKNTFD
ncbi:MAG: multicomponent Na+:H+ antiporter subunit G [Porticoccaceae bacterium]|jgi:multicomponent Na+:H+ antiporter subunit G